MARLSKVLPDWLCPSRDAIDTNKHTLRSRAYYRALHRATPAWLWGTEHEVQYRATYKEASRLRNNGENVHVDHIVPLQNKYVCGLAVPWNLQILPAHVNVSKSNNWWPDCPWDNHELFEGPEQFSLGLKFFDGGGFAPTL